MMLLVAAATAQTPPVVEVSHRHLETLSRRLLRLRPKESVWIRVVDANPLIYSYQLQSETVPEDHEAAEAFRRLVGRAPAPAAAERLPAGLAPPAAAAEGAFIRLGTGILDFATFLARMTVFTDTAPGSGDLIQSQVRAALDSAARQLGVSEYLVGDSLLPRALRLRYDSLGQRQAAHQALYAQAAQLVPSLLALYHRLQDIGLPAPPLLFQYPGSGDVLVSLKITNVLGDSVYARRRYAGSVPVGVAEIRPAFPKFAFSAGLTGVFGDRKEVALRRVSNPPALDTFEVLTSTRSDLRLLPTVYVTWQAIARLSHVFGVTLGAGIRSDNVSQINETTDLAVLATFGYEWLRLSAGLVYTSEATAPSGLGPGNTTTDPNVLNRSGRERHFRIGIALHATH